MLLASFNRWITGADRMKLEASVICPPMRNKGPRDADRRSVFELSLLLITEWVVVKEERELLRVFADWKMLFE